MKKLRKLRENKKGFTLVEVIVVLVIIAILAALMIPSLTGYIAKADNAAALAEGRTVLIALQTEASENGWTDDADIVYADVAALSELPVTDVLLTGVVFDANGKVTDFVYTATNAQTVTYDSTTATKFEIS